MESPEVRDAHAEFRKGAKQKLAIGAAVVAAVIAGLVLLSAGEERAKAPPQAEAESSESGPVIGRTLPPNRTQLKEDSAAEHKAAFERTEQRARAAERGEEPERPTDVPAEQEFQSAFENSAE